MLKIRTLAIHHHPYLPQVKGVCRQSHTFYALYTVVVVAGYILAPHIASRIERKGIVSQSLTPLVNELPHVGLVEECSRVQPGKGLHDRGFTVSELLHGRVVLDLGLVWTVQ